MSETVTETNTSEPGKKKGSKKFLIIIILVVGLLGGGGGGFYVWRSSANAAAAQEKGTKSDKKSKTAKDEEAEEPTDEEKPAKKSGKKDSAGLKDSLPDDKNVKQIIELQPFIVNLADAEQARYLRLTVSLGIGGEGGESEKPNPLFITRVRNAILSVLSDKKSEEILSIEGKTKLRKELLKAAQAASEEPEVEAIYITDFIVQL